MTTKDGKHSLADGYLLNRVLDYKVIQLGAGVKGTIKQAMSLHTLIECECVEDRQDKKGKSQLSKLLDNQEKLRHEMEEISLLLMNKDIEIAHLKAQLEKALQVGPGSEDDQNAELSAKVDELKDRLLKNHEEADARLSLVLQILHSKPPHS